MKIWYEVKPKKRHSYAHIPVIVKAKGIKEAKRKYSWSFDYTPKQLIAIKLKVKR